MGQFQREILEAKSKRRRINLFALHHEQPGFEPPTDVHDVRESVVLHRRWIGPKIDPRHHRDRKLRLGSPGLELRRVRHMRQEHQLSD